MEEKAFFINIKDASDKRIQINLDQSEFQLAWQRDGLLIFWNGVNITSSVLSVDLHFDTQTNKKNVELTVLASLLAPRPYEELS